MLLILFDLLVVVMNLDNGFATDWSLWRSCDPIVLIDLLRIYMVLRRSVCVPWLSLYCSGILICAVLSHLCLRGFQLI